MSLIKVRAKEVHRLFVIEYMIFFIRLKSARMCIDAIVAAELYWEQLPVSYDQIVFLASQCNCPDTVPPP